MQTEFYLAKKQLLNWMVWWIDKISVKPLLNDKNLYPIFYRKKCLGRNSPWKKFKFFLRWWLVDRLKYLKLLRNEVFAALAFKSQINEVPTRVTMNGQPVSKTRSMRFFLTELYRKSSIVEWISHNRTMQEGSPNWDDKHTAKIYLKCAKCIHCQEENGIVYTFFVITIQ